MKILTLALCLAWVGACATAQPVQPDRRFTGLSTGKLYVPDHLTPRDGRVDLIVHFHGGDRTGYSSVG